MPAATRRRLASLVRRPDADLAEAALLVCAEADPSLDVDAALLRLDALADGLRASGFVSSSPEADARALAAYLGRDHGFAAAEDRTSDTVLLRHVLDQHRGSAVTLTILYVAVARRLRVPAFPIGLPGLVVAGVGGRDRPVVLDPSRRGALLEQGDLAQHVEVATAGQLAFRRSMLRPSPPANVVRRLLNELGQAFTEEGRPDDARWAIELKLVLPNRMPDDHRVLGDLLVQVGRFDVAAEAYETYLELSGADAPDADEVRHAAIAARARLN